MYFVVDPVIFPFGYNYSEDSINATIEVGGCIEEYANNYDINAHLYDPFNPCIYLQEISFPAGPNMFSLSILPDGSDPLLFDVLNPILDYVTLVKNETSNAIYQDQSGFWTDNIGTWEPSEGYILYIDSNQILNLSTQNKIDLPLNIDLDFLNAITNNKIPTIMNGMLNNCPTLNAKSCA